MAFYIVPYFRKKENHLFLKSDIYKAKHAAVHGAISHTERKPWRNTPASTSLLSQDGFVFPLIPASTYNID